MKQIFQFSKWSLQWRSFTNTQSKLLENDDLNRDRDRKQTPSFSSRTEHCYGGVFTRYSINASVNGDFNRGHKNFLIESLKN